MDKFLDIPEQDLVVNGTSDAGAVAPIDLVDAAVNFITSGVQVGDIVHQSTDNKYFVVDEVTSGTELKLSALDGGTEPIPSGKDYFIHSATASKSQLVSCVGIGLIEQATTSTVKITYDDASSSDIVTLVHSPVSAGSEAMRDAIQNEVVRALQTPWTSVSNSVSLPKDVIGVSIA